MDRFQNIYETMLGFLEMENIQKELCRRMYLYGMRKAEGNAPDNQLL